MKTMRILSAAFVLFAAMTLAACGGNASAQTCCHEDCTKECRERCEKDGHVCSKDPNDKSCCIDAEGNKKENCCDGAHEGCCSKKKAA